MVSRTLRISLGLCMLLALSAASCVSSRDVLHVGQRISQAAPSPARGTPTHFISWNVHKADDERFTREVEDLLAAIPKEDGVILCMQEVRSSTYDLIKNLHSEKVSGHYAPSWHYRFSKRSTGVMTVGNWSLPASGAERLGSPGRELYLASPKVSLRTELPLADGKALQIINCHGLNFVSQSVFSKQLDEIFASLRDREQPAIVCGDFNVWSGPRLEMLRDKARQAGLDEALPATPGKSPAPRWLRKLKPLNGFDPDIPLDRIFSRGIEVLECYYAEESLSSDHLPLILRFTVDPQA